MKQAEINKLTKNCFKKIGKNGVFVIGCNTNADVFINMYKNDIKINSVISLKKEDLNKNFNGFKIKGKRNINSALGKAIICDYLDDELLDFLRSKNIDIGIYSSEFVYPGRQELKFNKNSKKKYHIGYVAGVFDLFHIGHLNILKNAKELCDYLIVGIVTDKGAIEKNNKDLVIPFNERFEIVKSCRYVDEAVEIPFEYCSSYYAYRKYHFDIQISGSDHKNDISWKRAADDLKKHGSNILYLPYTKQTSSTAIKRKINSK